MSLAAAEEKGGLAVLVDEAQDLAKDELTTLAVVSQAAARDSWPVLFALVGPPNLPQTLADARTGVTRGQSQLDNGFFRTRWDRTTRSEKEYLCAMCPEGDTGIGSGEVVSRLGKRIGSLDPRRNTLLRIGLIYAPDHGVVAFTVPGMSGFISRQPGRRTRP